jgi:hypothetical protein
MGRNMIWREITELKGFFISESGDLKDETGKIRKQYFDRCGYYRYSFKLNGKNVNLFAHRLTAKYFCEGDLSLPVNHIDGNKTNNHYSNLEFVTNAQNVRHAMENGLWPKQKKGNDNPRSVAVIAIKDCALIEFIGIRHAARELGLNQASIQVYLKKGIGKLKGYQFHRI